MEDQNPNTEYTEEETSEIHQHSKSQPSESHPIQLPDFLTNPSNQFFLHPKETPSVVLVSPLLNANNYHTWARAMAVALISKNKIGFINGSITPPLETDLNYFAWQRCNNMVVAWIHKSTSQSIVQSIIWIENAQDVWLDLQRRFSRSDVFRISDLQEEIYRLQQGEKNVTEFFTELKTLCDELDNLKPLPVCKYNTRCSCGGYMKMQEYRERDHMIRFLKGLNDQYSQVRSQIMLIDPLPDVTRVFAMIVQQERQFQGEIRSTNPIKAQAFADIDERNMSKRFFNGRGSFSGFRGRGRSTNYNYSGRNSSSNTYGGRGIINRLCTHYGRSNYTVDTCFHIHGFPPRFKTRNDVNSITNSAAQDTRSEQSGLPFSNDQYQQILSLL
ncbi:uncharacterized protein LOC133315950 [Gastrolobium bilobum]|uniref:uncharacterized protein LOC133315950 n=1 Tax=Gastrolobium bilobum TaxID=150636 RepID=UPI002AB012C0|nr:uncharacterized protein LOC133315950 [Gastrolobium bilobum]